MTTCPLCGAATSGGHACSTVPPEPIDDEASGYAAKYTVAVSFEPSQVLKLTLPVLDWSQRVRLARKWGSPCGSPSIRPPKSEGELAAMVVTEPLRDPDAARALIQHLAEVLAKSEAQ